VNEHLASESHQLRELKIHKIHASMAVQVDSAELITTLKRRQFQVCLSRAREAAPKWSEGDWERAIERLEHEIHQMSHVKWKLAKQLARIKTADKEEIDGAVNTTTDKSWELQVNISDAETEPTTRSITDTDLIASQVAS
jgi:septal ring factor EnvC (AmiA/AmiB activator)